MPTSSHGIQLPVHATIRLQNDPESRLQNLAVGVNELAALQRLRHLCLESDELKFIGAVVAFISSRECTSILTEWSAESQHASRLDRLARACQMEGNLLESLRPFKGDQRVEDRFKGDIQEQYLASMATARRAYPADQTSTWLERLRIFIVLRALDALETGAVRERHILNVCVTIRDVCESELSTRRQWIRSIEGTATGYREFAAETAMKCRHELAKSGKAPGRDFFRDLLWVLERTEWSALPVKDHRFSNQNPAPYSVQPGSEDWSSFFRSLDVEYTNFQPTSLPLYPSASGIFSQPTDIEHSQSRRIRLGNGLRLEGIERSLYLRHSWYHLTKLEEAALLRRIEELLPSNDLADSLGAAITACAVLASQSMHDASKISLKPLADSDDWYLELRSGQLIRRPARFGRRWRSNSKETNAGAWVHQLAERWVYSLNPKVLAPLRRAASKSTGALNIGMLWAKVSSFPTVAAWFDARLTDTPELARISSPSTANMVAMTVFDNTHDQSMTRLISSDLRTALPAACAYGAYRAPDVLLALNNETTSGLATLVEPINDPNLNCSGSELDILMPKLKLLLAHLTQKVDKAAQGGNWVEHHNLLTALAVLSLLASTGARPVNSPFESIAWFDLHRALVYVEDKSAGPTQGSRICVLSDYATALMKDQYLPHLAQLANSISVSAPRFASEIGKVLQAESEAALPLFFFVRSEPTFDWLEVSETNLSAICQFNWPLPWNLFRHITSTTLRRWGLHPDIRDALLGHADRDAESHGDFSTRIPIADLEQARPLVNRLQSEIGLSLPMASGRPSISANPAMDKSLATAPHAFGRKARAYRRNETHEAAKRLALVDIETEMNGRTVDKLTADELDIISRKMLARKDGMPHIHGSLRYEFFEEFLNTAWRTHNQHARLKRRYVLAREGRQLFNETSIVAQQRLKQVCTAFEAIATQRIKIVERPVFAAYMAALDLVMYSKLAHFPVLCALLCNHHSLQLVRFNDRYWLEWAFNNNWVDGKPVFRVEISHRAAHWIALARSGKSYKEVPAFPTNLTPLATSLGFQESALHSFISTVAQLQAQSNYLTMPGLMASYLVGRKHSAALPHSEWIRASTGARPMELPETKLGASPEAPDTAEALAEHFFRSHHQPPVATEETALKRCTTLFTEIGKCLNSNGTNSKITTEIAAKVKNSGFSRGDAPFLLAHFVTHLLKRKPKYGTRDRLRAKTALRYWYSLSGPFLEAALDANLLDMEEDELTTLYAAIVGTWSAGKTRESSSGDPLETDVDDAPALTHSDIDSTEIADENLTDASLRTASQLREFHDFVRATYGLADPDWSEVCDGDTVGVGRPGLLLLKEYKATLTVLFSGKAVADLDDHVLSQGFVMVACCRFGLRVGEAVGLHRCDWTDVTGAEVVLVQGNSTRPLKTTPSRRKVPLIETLDEIEKTVIETVLKKWALRNCENLNTPLLPEVSHQTFKYTKNKISGGLLSTIKSVTGNESSTVHMLRHGFAMRALCLLLNLQLDPSAEFNVQSVGHARRLLLGSDTTDRRTLWAVARLLGHANPGVTLQSYINCIFLWFESVAAPMRRTLNIQQSRILNLDKLDLQHDYLDGIVARDVAVKKNVVPPLLRSLRFLRLIVVGQPEEKAQENSGVAPSGANELAAAMNRVSERLSASDTRYSGYKLLGGISLERMTNLVDLVAEQRSLENTAENFDNWIYTIGSSRQILLFDKKHILWFSNFCYELNLEKEDVWLIKVGGKENSFYAHVEASGLDNYLKLKQEMKSTFQLDVARFGDPELVAPNRIAVVVGTGGKLNSSFELLLLWTIWISTKSISRLA